MRFFNFNYKFFNFFVLFLSNFVFMKLKLILLIISIGLRSSFVAQAQYEFNGRIMQKNSFFAKYINSPETQFFKKGNNLYNIDRARKLSNKINQIFFTTLDEFDCEKSYLNQANLYYLR